MCSFKQRMCTDTGIKCQKSCPNWNLNLAQLVEHIEHRKQELMSLFKSQLGNFFDILIKYIIFFSAIIQIQLRNVSYNSSWCLKT